MFLILSNLSARDSFLVYHQEFMAKRLLDCLNDPKVEIEVSLLRKIAEQYGSVSVANPLGMLRDITLSL